MILHDETVAEISPGGDDGPVPDRPFVLHPRGPAPPFLPPRGARDLPGGARPSCRPPPAGPAPAVFRDHSPGLHAPGRTARPGPPLLGFRNDRPVRGRRRDARGRRPRPHRGRHRFLRIPARGLEGNPLGIPGNAARPRADPGGARGGRGVGARVPGNRARRGHLPGPRFPGRTADGRRLPVLPAARRGTAPRVRQGGELFQGAERRGDGARARRRDHPRQPAGEGLVPGGLLRADGLQGPGGPTPSAATSRRG
jgi:hypothetical protein